MRKLGKRQPLDPSLPGQYGRMTADELDREVEKYDREFIIDESEPLTVGDRNRHHRAREHARRRGRPRVGNGAKRVLVTIERGLLKRTDAYAKRNGLTRAALIAEGLMTILRKSA